MVNVFSFCLYGPRNPRYYIPLLENIQIAAQYFLGWKVYIYYAPDVDPEYVRVLGTYSNVVLRPTGILGEPNMIQRFFAIDEPDVEIMMVRDADSLIHWRDRWAIYRFVEKIDFSVHTIRDHAHHASRIMGGLWGMRKIPGLLMSDEYGDFKKNPRDLGIAHDQNFLGVQFYPKIKDQLWVHYSEGGLYHSAGGLETLMSPRRIFDGEHGEMIPFRWTEEMYCGRIEIKPLEKKIAPFTIRGR